MKINKQETIINIYDENNEIISTKKYDAFLVYPDDNKNLYDKKARAVIKGYVCLGNLDQLDYYSEIDK